ncbi:DNA recombination protein RmuC [Patescibacteria group bacterium]
MKLKQINERLKENNTTIQREHRSVGERLDTAAKAVNTVTARLSKIEEGNKRIYDVGKDISSLQELLKAPKLRGGLGELFLNDLLAQIFPKENYSMQYSFKSGDTVDAVIHVRDNHLIPVDSKFPLENFKKMYEEEDEKGRADYRKAFINDVKKRIDEISSKYILPDEGTFDFALMYIPAENVYYEMIIKSQEDSTNLSNYAFTKKVIPVSPNTFYVYLQTILIGLKGFQIEKKAGEILTSLSRLRGDFEKFGDDFGLVGKHLGHARGRYENSEKKLSRFSDKLTQVESLSTPTQEEKLLK